MDTPGRGECRREGLKESSLCRRYRSDRGKQGEATRKLLHQHGIPDEGWRESGPKYKYQQN